MRGRSIHYLKKRTIKKRNSRFDRRRRKRQVLAAGRHWRWTLVPLIMHWMDEGNANARVLANSVFVALNGQRMSAQFQISVSGAILAIDK